MSATTTRIANAEAALALLCARWERCFFIFPGLRLQLKIGIHKDIPNGLIEPKALRRAFQHYTNDPGYLNAMRGADRFKWCGRRLGCENDAKNAQARFNGIRKFRKNRRQQRHEEGGVSATAFTVSCITITTATALATKQLGFAPRGRAKAPRCRMSKCAASERGFDLTPEMLLRRGNGTVFQLGVVERMARSGAITGYSPWASESNSATRVWTPMDGRETLIVHAHQGYGIFASALEMLKHRVAA